MHSFCRAPDTKVIIEVLSCHTIHTLCSVNASLNIILQESHVCISKGQVPECVQCNINSARECNANQSQQCRFHC